MAAIDKIYGSREEWNILYTFLVQTQPEYIDKYMYPQPEIEGPLSNFSKEADKWLWKNCHLDFVRKRLKEQYHNRIEILEEEPTNETIENNKIKDDYEIKEEDLLLYSKICEHEFMRAKLDETKWIKDSDNRLWLIEYWQCQKCSFLIKNETRYD